MKKDLLLICAGISPGPFKVVQNLRSVARDQVDIEWLPLERIVSPHIPFKSRKMNYRYLRLHDKIKRFRVKELLRYGDRIFFVGWGAANAALLEAINRKGIRPSLIMCSTIGQSDFNDFERRSITDILEHVRKGNIRLFLLNKRLYESLGRMVPNSVYFPHTIDVRQYDDITPVRLPGINGDIFCSIRPGKNVMNQITGFKMSGIPGTLHVNFRNRLISKFIGEIGVDAKTHAWLEQKDYYALISGMTFSLQVTFTESFNYAVAERMCLGVPVLTSFDIYLTAGDVFLSRYLCIRRLDTPSEIGDHIRKIAANRKLRDELARRCRTRIRRIAAENNRTAIQILHDILK